MGQSLSQLYVHLIFSTKGRKPFIKKEIRGRLNSYIVGILKAQSCPLIITNCVEDHVHSLFKLSKNVALSKVVEEVKRQSSKWMKERDDDLHHFQWQIGYAAFSVSSYKVDVVSRYVLNQEEHHRKRTFKEETEKLIKEYNIVEYNEKYFWN